MKTYPLPEDSLIKWEVAPRNINRLAFQHPLRNTRWDDLEFAYRNREGHGDNFQFLQDMHAGYSTRLVDEQGVELKNNDPNLDYLALNTFLKVAHDCMGEMLAFPFTDVATITQFQEGVEEARSNTQVNGSEFITGAYLVFAALHEADSVREDQGLHYERQAYKALDAFVEIFPDLSSKLWKDLRLWLLSSHLSGSPLHDYRRILESDSIVMRASSLQSGTPLYEIEPEKCAPSSESDYSFLPSLAVRQSYQRQKAFALIRDALSLALTTIGVAQAVEKYRLARVEFGKDISLKALAHPLFYTNEQREGPHEGQRVFCPNDLEFSSEEQLLLVTGPTEGGKTTIVRSLGTAILMGHAFGYACASSAQMPLFTNMLSSFVHTDNFHAGVSTFRAEVDSLNRQYLLMRPDVFFAGDETLRTSEPSVGPEILPSIIEALLKKGIKGVIATHYHDAVRTLEGNPALKLNFVDARRFYALRKGVSPGGYAFESAQRAGLFPEMLGERANDEYAHPERPLQVFEPRPFSLPEGTLQPRSLAQLLETVEIPQTRVKMKTRLDPVPTIEEPN